PDVRRAGAARLSRDASRPRGYPLAKVPGAGSARARRAPRRLDRDRASEPEREGFSSDARPSASHPKASLIPTRGKKLAPDEALGYDPQTLPSRGRRGKSLGSQIATQISTSDPAQALCGALLAAAPFVLVVTLRTYPPLEAGGAPLAFIAGISSAALLIIGSLSLEYLPRAARTLVTIGIATGAGLAVPTLANSPSLSLLALAGTALALHVLWPSAARRIATPDPRLTALARARAASLVAAGAWLVRAAEEIAPTVDFILAASSAFMLAGLSGLVSIPRMRRSIGRKLIAALFAAATVGLALAGSFGSTVTVLHGAAFAALA